MPLQKIDIAVTAVGLFLCPNRNLTTLAAAVLAAAWQVVSAAHARDIRVAVAGLDNSQKVSLEARLLKPEDALKTFDGLYTDEFVRW
ncbi:MAG TPA: hypothetical protein VFO15_17635 [Xanthobacteraceae bacterium]|nr:hypothetical protein [Xanthobacteraceae bacterium]